MTTDTAQLFTRIRAEFREMPGLRLTVDQAAKLWQLEHSVCRAILVALVRDRFLLYTRGGDFIRADQQ